MNRFKKAISVGMSAALLASLFTAMVAAPVSASVSATSVGTFAQGTTSTGTVTFTLVERAAPDNLPAAAGSVTITINDSLALAPEPGVAFSGTPSTAGSTGSLGVSATVAANVLTISWTNSDTVNSETIIVSGLKISADATATPGPITAFIAGPNAANFINATSATATATATGVIQDTNALASGADTADVLVTSVCPFDTTADSAVNSTATFSDAADPRAITADAAGVLNASGVQVVTFAAGALTHAAGVTVTQTISQLNCNTVLGGTVISGAVGVIANALAYTSLDGNVGVFPGENNQLAGRLQFVEPAAGFLADSSTLTLKITTAGVLFSSPPTAVVTVGNLVLTSATNVSEVQTVTLAGAGVADTFTLTFGAFTTAAIPITADGTAVDTALSTGVGSIPAADVTVTGAVGGPYTATFTGANTGINVAQLTATPTDVAPIGPFTVTPATTVNGTSTSAISLSTDRTTATITVTTASTGGPSTIVVSNIRYDVASTVVSGTLVTVEATTSGGKIVNPSTRTNAQVGRVFNASAPTPNVNIGQNGQVAGLVTIVEVTAGSFTDGSGSNNVFEICPDATATFTSPGPSAFVTGGVAAGNLILREGASASTDNIVPGTADPAFPGCYYWTIWTKSTTASTITIGSTATVGPLVNVLNNVPAGPLNASLYVGVLATIHTNTGVVVAIANRVFPGQVKVTALSQPIIGAGATHASAGDITVEETGNGQLKLGTRICVEIVPNQNTGILTDVYLSSLTTADLPLATAANGVVVGPVTMSTQTCSGLNGNAGTLFDSFSFVITQQSTTGTGKVTISNIHYSAVNDAATGPVQVNVWGFNVGGASIDFQRVISNARIGNPVSGTAATRLGVTQVGAFTTSTKVAKVGKYVTYRFDFGVAAAGKAVQIWGATKTGNDWSAFAVVTTRTANASGVVYYYIRQSAASWKSYRANWTGGGTLTPARQSRWIP